MNTSTPIVAVNVDGLEASWDGETFTGDPILVDEAKLSVQISANFRLGDLDVTADGHSPFGAAVALASHRPGRTVFTVLPEGVAEQLAPSHDEPEDIG